MSDDRGVLGNLPRSRPGTRSEKRTAASAKRSGAAAEKPSSHARAATKPPAGRTGQRPEAPAEHRSSDPVGGAIRGAVKATRNGVRLAGALTQEVLRRVPRP
jgi:hypothetical protein